MIDAVLEFLSTRTPAKWCELALADIDTLLMDHASLELKAAHQAQQLIWKYGTAKSELFTDSGLQQQLIQQMSRLAREELRHFEQVVKIIHQRGQRYSALTASGYAAALHGHLRNTEPERLIDSLIVGALIEARSCERFFVLSGPLQTAEPDLAAFYASLLQSEARHFQNYLELAHALAGESLDVRIDELREVEGALMFADSSELRFHSGVPN